MNVEQQEEEEANDVGEAEFNEDEGEIEMDLNNGEAFDSASGLEVKKGTIIKISMSSCFK
jgi:hypothetical protein